MFSVSDDPIDRNQFIESLKNEKAGALALFEGWVRNHNEGKTVQSLEYQVYPELAVKEGLRILEEAKRKFNLHEARCIHRVGHLRLGDVAVTVGTVSSHRDDAFKAARYIIDQIKLRLPIWKKEHYRDAQAQWVSCQHHSFHVHFEEADFYIKQNGIVNQEILKKARVLVVGAGGLGCPVLTNLAAAGIGQLTLIDFDKIDISNIHRQTLYAPHLVGEKKVEIAAQKLRELNPFIKVTGVNTQVDTSNATDLIQNQDLIIDCTDNMRTKFILHDACFKNQVPLISASIFKNEGQVRTFYSQSDSGCLHCTYEKVPDDSLIGNCNDFGALAAALGVIGSIQSSEAIAFLQNKKNATLAETFYFDLNNLEPMKIKNKKREGCHGCQGHFEIEKNNYLIDYESLNEDFVVVDIRHLGEDSLQEYLNSNKKVAVLCHRGLRSLKVVEALRSQGHAHFYSVRGGACSLS